MRVALADGRVVKAGGRVVKNVAGYDLCKLFTGSYGTLGLILELTFKLRPTPKETGTVAARAPLASLLGAAREVLEARLLPVAVELLSPSAAARIEVSDEETHPTLLIRYAGTPEAVAFQVEQTTQLLRGEGAAVTNYISDDERYWRELNALPLRDENQLVWRARVLPSELEALLNQAMKDGGSAILSSSSLWHAGVGDGRLRVISSSTEDAASCAASLESLRAWAGARGGSLVIESAPVEVKNLVDAWGPMGARSQLMQRVKEQLDPQDRLSPGRFHLEAV
jgi:FAD/FMN-containing dehydrogenase